MKFVLLVFLGAWAFADHTQHFNDLDLTQTSKTGCVGLQLKYDGKMSAEGPVNALVELNGASGVFPMRLQEDGFYGLHLGNCGAPCVGEKKAGVKVCAAPSPETRKMFYWAMANGHAVPWFIHVSVFGERPAEARDDYVFYFP